MTMGCYKKGTIDTHNNNRENISLHLHSLYQNNELFANLIAQKLILQNKSLSEAISEKKLYFRVSLIGKCNLACSYCHNEGGTFNGRLGLRFTSEVLRYAANIGFKRVQFTGGEPLLHDQLDQFVMRAKKYFTDVGLTTNGTLLDRNIEKIVDAGISRIHVSLSSTFLKENREKNSLIIPNWLSLTLRLAKKDMYKLRLNIPVPEDELIHLKHFLNYLSFIDCETKVFPILYADRLKEYPLKKLWTIVLDENDHRTKDGLSNKVILKDYMKPAGIRCTDCHKFNVCKEQSRSLRLGADMVLRPCLASRSWDEMIIEKHLEDQLYRATLLALDYNWHADNSYGSLSD